MWFQCMGYEREMCEIIDSEFSKFPGNIFRCHKRHAYNDYSYILDRS